MNISLNLINYEIMKKIYLLILFVSLFYKSYADNFTYTDKLDFGTCVAGSGANLGTKQATITASIVNSYTYDVKLDKTNLPSYINVSNGGTLKPEGTVTFTITCTAPSESGSYNIKIPYIGTHTDVTGTFTETIGYLTVIITATTSSPTIPSSPANLASSNVSSSSCTLSWPAPSGTVSGYKIYQDGNLVQTVTSTNATINNLIPATSYSFTVSAYNSAGESAKSTAISVTTCPLAPSTPTGLNASNITKDGCSLSWIAASGTVTGYHIYQSGALLQTTTETNATINSLNSGISYSFTISGYNCGGESEQSSELSVLTIPSAPTGISVSEITNNSCNMSWNAPSSSIIGYNIYQNGIKVQTTSSTFAKFDNLNPFTSYNYIITAYNNTGESEQGTGVTFITKSIAAPTDLTARDITSSTCSLTWTAPRGAVSGYNIYQYYPYIGKILTTNGNTVTVNNLNPSSMYVFSVTAYNDLDESANASTITVNTLALSKLPSVPLNLNANNITSTGCTLSWTAVSGANGYNVYKNGALLLTTISSNATITNLTTNTAYAFSVSAYNSVGESAQSTSVSYGPSNLLLTPTSTGCSLSWNTPTIGNYTGYYIYMFINGGSGPKFPVSSTSFTFSPLTAGTTYQFYVTAYNSSGESFKSNVVSYTKLSSSSFKSVSIDSATIPNIKTASSADAKNIDQLTVMENVLLYPNPVHDKLSVQGLFDFDVKILDLNGKEVLNKTKQNESIDISGLASGTYIVRLQSGGKTFIKKIIKQ